MESWHEKGHKVKRDHYIFKQHTRLKCPCVQVFFYIILNINAILKNFFINMVFYLGEKRTKNIRTREFAPKWASLSIQPYGEAGSTI